METGETVEEAEARAAINIPIYANAIADEFTAMLEDFAEEKDVNSVQLVEAIITRLKDIWFDKADNDN